MKVTVKTKDGYIERFIIEASAVEALILNRSLAMFATDEETAEIDRRTAELMGEAFKRFEERSA